MDYHELEKMTVNRLREEAKKFPDVKGLAGMKKEELVHILIERMGIVVPDKKKKSVPAPIDRPTLKARITELQTTKVAARAEHNRKTADLLRRRIHSLKRRLRKMD